MRTLRTGDRAGPFSLNLASGKEVFLSMFRLPLNDDRISCTISRAPSRPASVDRDEKTGLSTRKSFVAAAAQMKGTDYAITMVDVPGLPDACAKMGADGADKLMLHIGAAVADIGAKAAARLPRSRISASSRTLPLANLISAIVFVPHSKKVAQVIFRSKRHWSRSRAKISVPTSECWRFAMSSTASPRATMPT